MKSILLLLMLLAVGGAISFIFLRDFTVISARGNNKLSEPVYDSLNYHLLSEKSREADQFCRSNEFNDSFCLLVNMTVHSGKHRFYVWDLERNKVTDSGLVSHGCGAGWWGRVNTVRNPKFSNEYESHCSSAGKYKVGKRDYSQWGINVKYFLYGLDSSNSNAYGRLIVLHSWDEVPDQEVYPYGTPEGWGCPAVSNEFMKRLDEKLSSAKKPVLLWVFPEE